MSIAVHHWDVTIQLHADHENKSHPSHVDTSELQSGFMVKWGVCERHMTGPGTKSNEKHRLRQLHNVRNSHCTVIENVEIL